MTVAEFITPLLVPIFVVVASLCTLGIVNNGSAGEYPVSQRASIYLPIYIRGSLLIAGGLLHFFMNINASSSKDKAFYIFNLVFLAYVLASFSNYVGTYSVSLSLT
jgi:hypothetical protein